jgi:DNA-directed RNA polymerase subunit H (RpoH/RPB5)
MENVKELNKLLTQLKMDIKMAIRYFKIHKTVVEMLEARGYIVSKEEMESTQSLLKFVNYLDFKNTLDNAEFIKFLVLELLESKVLLDDQKKYENFVKTQVPDLAEDFDAAKVYQAIKSTFKVIGKPFENQLKDRKVYNSRDDHQRIVDPLNQIYSKPDGSIILTYFYYNNKDIDTNYLKRTEDVIREFIGYQKRHPTLKEIIFISDINLNTQMSEDLKKYTQNMRITLFQGDHLLFNITKHFLVPKHHLMSDQEYKEFVKNEKGMVTRLPIIFETDPISRFYGAKPGQIFKIIRENLSDDTMVRYSEFYRYVTTEVKK